MLFVAILGGVISAIVANKLLRHSPIPRRLRQRHGLPGLRTRPELRRWFWNNRHLFRVKPHTGQQRQYKRLLYTYYERPVVLVLALAFGLAIGSWVAAAAFERELAAVSKHIATRIRETEDFYREYFESLELVTPLLRQIARPLNSATMPSSCETDWISSRSNAEIACSHRAGIAGGKNRGYASLSRDYRLCMNGKGWLTLPCPEGNPDSTCIGIPERPGSEILLYWNTVEPNLKSFCASREITVEGEHRAKRICEYEAATMARRSWYLGYTDVERLFSIIEAYKRCMLREGWYTRVCKPEDLSSAQCVEISFDESPCADRARRWLDRESGSSLCVDTRWISKTRTGESSEVYPYHGPQFGVDTIFDQISRGKLRE